MNIGRDANNLFQFFFFISISFKICNKNRNIRFEYYLFQAIQLYNL